MVYPGQPSKGCDTCRKRKVKCDETKPICQRCTKAGHPCAGYRDMTKILFKSDNVQARKLVFRRQAGKLKSSPSSTPPESAVVLVDNRTVIEDYDFFLLAPECTLQLWKEQATCFFLDQFLLPPTVKGSSFLPGWLEFVPDLCLQSKEESFFKQALTAISYMTYGNVANMPSLKRFARENYGKALQSALIDLNVRERAVQDSTLAGVLLLCMYGQVSGDLHQPVAAHALGLERLIELRGLQSFGTPFGTSMLRHVRCLLQIQAIRRGQRGSSIQKTLFDQMPKNMPSAKVAFNSSIAAELVVEIENLLDLASDDDLCKSLPDVLSRGHSVDGELINSVEGSSLPWWVCREIDSPFPSHLENEMLYSKRILIYQSLWPAVAWNLYRFTRIILHGALIRCKWRLDSIDADAENFIEARQHFSVETSMGVIHAMAEDILASLPFVLGDVDPAGKWSPGSRPKAVGALMNLYSIMVILSSQFTTLSQRTRASRVMRRMGYTLGIKQALKDPHLVGGPDIVE